MIFDNLRSTRPFKATPRMIVLHWTAGVASDPMRVVNAMRARKGALTPDGLSVHYVIGKTGQVLQTASLDRRCLHAGGVNDSSIGIEVSCPGFSFGPYDREPDDWTVYRDIVKGRCISMVDYRPEQYAALRDVLLHISAETGIPLVVPTESIRAMGAKDHADFLLMRQMTKTELGSFRGVIGHYHCSKTKVDCGTRPLLWVQGGM